MKKRILAGFLAVTMAMSTLNIFAAEESPNIIIGEDAVVTEGISDTSVIEDATEESNEIEDVLEEQETEEATDTVVEVPDTTTQTALKASDVETREDNNIIDLGLSVDALKTAADNSGDAFEFDDSSGKITIKKDVIIEGKENSNYHLYVDTTEPVYITLAGMRIEDEENAPFDTIEGANITLNLVDGSTNAFTGSETGIKVNGALTIDGGDNGTGELNATGNITGTGDVYSYGIYAYSDEGVASITIEDGEVTGSGSGSGSGYRSGYGYGIYARGDSASITIEDGEVTGSGSGSGDGSGSGYGYGIYARGDSASITIEDGEVTGSGSGDGYGSGYGSGYGYGIYARGDSASITIEDGEVTGSGSGSGSGYSFGYGIYAGGDSASITIEDGEVTGSGNGDGDGSDFDSGYGIYAYSYEGVASITIEDGEVTGDGDSYGYGSGSGYGSGYGIYAYSYEGVASITIEDGEVTGDGSGSGDGYGDGSGYGIYAYSDEGVASITIEDGEVTGSGSGDGDGSGYGSGYGNGNGYGIYARGGDSASITIEDGAVTAEGYGESSNYVEEYGIYANGSNPSIIIAGGSVLAEGETPISPTPKNGQEASVEVQAYVFTLDENIKPDSEIITNVGNYYGTKGISIDEDGKVYLYFPADLEYAWLAGDDCLSYLYLENNPNEYESVFNINNKLDNADYIIGGDSNLLTVKATDENITGDISYQWYSSDDDNVDDSDNKVGNNSNEYKPLTDTLGTTYYYCVTTYANSGNEYEITSNIATIDVQAPFNINNNIEDTNYIIGDETTQLAIELNLNSNVDKNDITYQWYSSDDDNVDDSDILVADNSNEYIPSTDEVVTTYYYCVVSYKLDGEDAIYTETSNIAEIDVQEPFNINNNIEDTNYIIGEEATPLAIELNLNSNVDKNDITYQWYSNDENTIDGVIIEGAESNEYTPSTDEVGTIYYYCVVSYKLDGEDATYTETSNVAEVTVNKERSSSGGPTTYSSKWDEPYTLTLNYNDGSAPEDIEYDEETDIDLSTYEATRDGYTFTGWYEDKDLENKVTEITLDEDKTLYAGWEEVETEEIEEPEDIWENPYIDVSSDDWFYDDVEYVDQNELMYGMEDDIFAPDTELSRGMIVTVLYRLAGEPDVNSSNNFEDIPKDAYYTDAVDWANEVGITNGYTDSEFGPEDLVTREQLAVFFNNYADYIELDTNSNEEVIFTDADLIAPWAVDSVNWAVNMGLISGYPDGSLNPAGTGTRAEFASILNRFNLETK